MPQPANPSPAVLVVLATLATLVPTAARAQFHHETKLTASDAAEGDVFGFSVAISGHVAIVGAPGGDGASPTDECNSGAAYIYTPEPGAVTLIVWAVALLVAAARTNRARARRQGPITT